MTIHQLLGNINMEKKLVQVSKGRFEGFVKGNNLTVRPGSIIHQEEYVDGKGEVQARCTTSSWNSGITYEILSYENESTLDFVTNIFNQ